MRTEKIISLQEDLRNDFIYNLKYHIRKNIGNGIFNPSTSFTDFIESFVEQFYNDDHYSLPTGDLPLKFMELNFTETLYIIYELEDYLGEFGIRPTIIDEDKLINEYMYYSANYLSRGNGRKYIQHILDVCRKIFIIYHHHRRYGKLKKLAYKLQVKQELKKTKLTDDLIERIIKIV